MRAADVAEIHAVLEALDDEAFAARAKALLAERPTETARALVLRAGSDDPPGVNGARATRRNERRAEGLALFGADVRAGGALLEELRDLLALSNPSDDERDLILAATRVVSRLGLHKLTVDVAWNLDESRPETVREAARIALYELVGRWFPSRADYEAARPYLEGRDADALFVAEFKRLAERERELLGAVIAHEPARAAQVFAVEHPASRAIAARELVRAVRLKQLEIPDALERLRARLRAEVHPMAYQAAIDATLQLLQGQPPDAPAIDALRELLGEQVEDRSYLAATLVQAFVRLPWETEPETRTESGAGGETGQRHVARGLSLVAEIVVQLADTSRPVDYDRLSLAIESLRGLAQRSGLDPGRRRALLAPAGEAVVDLALAGVGPLDARLDAARALDDFLDRDHLGPILALLEPGSPAHPSLRLNLLAAVERLAPEVAPSSEHADAIQRVLGSSLRSQDVDIRRRALEMLAGEKLAPQVAAEMEGAGRSRLIEVLLEGFAVDPSARNQELRLALLAKFGPDPALAARLSASAGLDALIEANGRGPVALVETLSRLVGDDVEATMVAARRLARPPLPAGAPSAPATTSSTRRKFALRLVASVGEETRARFSADDRNTILRWAVDQGLDRRAGAPLPTALLPNLVAWLSGEEDLELSAAERAWGRALFAADLAERRRAPDAPPIEPDDPVHARVREAYAEALSASREAGAVGPPSPRRVRLDRAKFSLSTGLTTDARRAAEDFAVLLTAAPVGSSDFELLVDDLRKAIEAFDRANRPLDAARAHLRLVRRADWENGAQAEHLEDLERLVERALALSDADLLRGVRERLEELRAPRASDGTDGTDGSAGDVLRRILEDPASRARLDALTTRLAQAPAPGSVEDVEDGQNPPGGGGSVVPGR